MQNNMKNLKNILLVLLVLVLSACSNLSKQNVNDGPPQLPEINFGSSLTGFTTLEDDSDKFLILDNSNFVCDASESQTVKLAAIPVNNRVTVLDFVKSINPSRKSAFVMLRFDALTQKYFEYGGNAISSQTDSVINVSSNQFSSTIIPANSVVFLVSPNSFSYCDFGDSTDFTHIPLKSGWIMVSVPDGFFDSDVIEVYNALDSSEITMTEESPLEAGMYWFKIDIQDDRLFGDPVVEEPVDPVDPNNGATTQDDDSDLDESDSDSSDDQNTEENFNENIPRDFDEDGVPDDQDAFPFDNTESVDTDGDGTGDNADTDDDNDGILDDEDACPLVPAEGDSGEGDSGEGDSGEGNSGEGDSGEGDSGEGESGEGDSGEGDSGEGDSGECDFEEVEPGAVDSSSDTDGDGVTDDIDNCLFVSNPDQEDVNGFNDDNSLGDACEDLVFNLEAAEDENAEFNIEVSCLADDGLENECNFSIDFGVALESCPVLGGEDGVRNGSVCNYTLNEQDDITRVNTFTESFEYSTSTATVKISGDVRHLRFSDTSNLKEVVRFGDLNYRSLKGMFNGTSLVSAAGDMDSSNVTDLESTFFSAQNIESLDIDNWDVSSVESLKSTFYNVTSLESLNLNSWDVSGVTDMSFAFYNDNSTHELERLEISKWNVGNVTHMSNMFNYLMSLQELDVSCWDVSQVQNMEKMFQLSKISNLDLSRWNVAELQNAKRMFNSSQAGGLYDLSGWEFGATVDTSGMFASANLSELNLSDWKLENGATMETVFDTSNIDVLDFSNLAIEGDVNMTAMFGTATITSLDVSGWNSENANSVNMTTLFASADIDNDLLDLSTWKVEKVTNLGNSFLQSTINAVDLSNWNLSSLGSVGFIFMQSNISEFVLDDWTFKENARINNLFQNSSIVESVSMQNWDFANILNVNSGLTVLQSLNSLDLSGWAFDESDYTNIVNFFTNLSTESEDLNVVISDPEDWCFIVSEDGEFQILSGATFKNSDGAAVNLLDCDEDGLEVAEDNCPFVANADQNDFDSDGIGDACDDDVDGDQVIDVSVEAEQVIYNDICPLTPVDAPHVTEFGCLDTDDDGVMDASEVPVLGEEQALSRDLVDGDIPLYPEIDELFDAELPISFDNCPSEFNPDQADSDNDGVGDVCDLQDENDSDIILYSLPLQMVNLRLSAELNVNQFENTVVGDGIVSSLEIPNTRGGITFSFPKASRFPQIYFIDENDTSYLINGGSTNTDPNNNEFWRKNVSESVVFEQLHKELSVGTNILSLKIGDDIVLSGYSIEVINDLVE